MRKRNEVRFLSIQVNIATNGDGVNRTNSEAKRVVGRMGTKGKKEGIGDYEEYPNVWIPVGLVCVAPLLYSILFFPRKRGIWEG